MQKKLPPIESFFGGLEIPGKGQPPRATGRRARAEYARNMKKIPYAGTEPGNPNPNVSFHRLQTIDDSLVGFRGSCRTLREIPFEFIGGAKDIPFTEVCMCYTKLTNLLNDFNSWVDLFNAGRAKFAGLPEEVRSTSGISSMVLMTRPYASSFTPLDTGLAIFHELLTSPNFDKHILFKSISPVLGLGQTNGWDRRRVTEWSLLADEFRAAANARIEMNKVLFSLANPAQKSSLEKVNSDSDARFNAEILSDHAQVAAGIQAHFRLLKEEIDSVDLPDTQPFLEDSYWPEGFRDRGPAGFFQPR